MTSHPTPTALEGFAFNRLPSEELQRVQRHLLACESCEDAYLRVVFRDSCTETAPPGTLAAVRDRREQDYQGAIDRVLAQAREGFCRQVACAEPCAASDRLEMLLALPPAARAERISEDPAFQSWSLCERLIETCADAEFENPREALELAELAVAVAQSLAEGSRTEARIEDLRARSWGTLANAHRVLGDLAAAERSFETAEAHLAGGTGDPQEEARLLSLKASLRRIQLRIPEALDLLDQALDLYRLLGEQRLVGRMLIKKGVVLGQGDELEAAAEAVRQGLAKIDPHADARLDLYGRHNLVCLLLDAGRLLEAQAKLAEIRRLHFRHASSLNLVRLRWLEGRLATAIGRFDEAERALLEVRNGFLEHGLGKDAAVAALELAEVYVRQDATEALRHLAEEMVPIFQSPDVHREALAALILFQTAALRRRVTSELIQQVLAQVDLGRARRRSGQ